MFNIEKKKKNETDRDLQGLPSKSSWNYAQEKVNCQLLIVNFF